MTAIRSRRRRTELGLLVMIAIIVVAAYVLVSLGLSAALPADVVPFFVAVMGLFVVAHVAVRRLAPRADPLLVPLAVLLNGLGYVLIARLDEDLAAAQASWTAVGVAGFVGTLMVVRRVRSLERLTFTIGLVGVALLILPLVPGVGREVNGSRIWVELGPVSFQPGEFAKIALAIFFAGYLVERRELLGTATFRVGPFRTPEPKHLAPVLVWWAISLVVVVFQRDLGSALLFFVLFMSVLWVATERLTYLAVGFGLFGVGAWAAWTQFGHVQDRVTNWLDPWADPQDGGFQIIQSAYAFAWGGFDGAGLGRGIAGRIPFQETDFIFAVVGEELGLLGTTAVLAAFLLIIGSGFRVAVRCEDGFAKLLACGLTALVGFQAFLIMAGVTRLLPLTGVTLPFMSYGGSSLVANWILIALLVRISDEVGGREVVSATDVLSDDGVAA